MHFCGTRTLTTRQPGEGTEGGQTVLYVNQYYEKNLSTQEVTTHYYLGGKQVAYKRGNELRYPLDDHLFSSVGSMDSSGNKVATVRYFPYGGTRFQEGDLGFDKMFTGQRLDDTGLYYYNARYYDATIGRFISPDTVVPNPANPQTLNPYTYTLNNPMKYVDPTGHDVVIVGGSGESSEEDMAKKYEEFIDGLDLAEGENIYYVPDYDADLPFDLYNVDPRLDDLYEKLNETENLTNIKIIGFSEGAATVGIFFSKLANNPNSVSDSIRSELRAGILLECPTGFVQSMAIRSYNYTTLNNLPERLQSAGLGYIKLADIWNRASPVHGVKLEGWNGHQKSYDSRSWMRQRASNAVGHMDEYIPWVFSHAHNHIKHSNSAINYTRKVISGN